MREEEARIGSAAPAPASQAALLLLLLVLALLGGAAHVGGASVCDTVNCGMGNCSETPGLPPPTGHECRCDPGWSNALKLLPFSPCIIPNCSMDSACLNLSLTPPPPGLIPDVCSVVSCGAGGACKVVPGAPFSYSCECQPGYANLIHNVTTLPCVNCYLGSGCYAMGLGAPPPARLAPAPAPAPAPSGDDGPSEPSAPPPPSGTKVNATHDDSLGSVSSPSLVQLLLLLLVSVAAVQIVV